MSSACTCTTRAKARCRTPACSRLRTPKPANCWNWIPPATPCASVSPPSTRNGWRNWTARSSAPAWTRCGSTPPNRSRPRCNGFLKSAADGGAGEMERNIQHSTFNAQRPTLRCRRGFIRYWMLNVECWAFLLLSFSGLSLFAQASTNALPALAPPYGEIPPTFWERHGTMILVGGIALIVLAVLILWKLLQPKPPVILPPEVLAREALTKLLQPARRRKAFERSFANSAPLRHRRV